MLPEGKNGAYEPPLYQRQLWLFILACSIREGVCLMLATLTSMLRDDEGATMVEYGLMVALVAMVALAAVKLLGTNLSTLFNTVAQTV
jgi:pilus assembly protein Flp/PilA